MEITFTDVNGNPKTIRIKIEEYKQLVKWQK